MQHHNADNMQLVKNKFCLLCTILLVFCVKYYVLGVLLHSGFCVKYYVLGVLLHSGFCVKYYVQGVLLHSGFSNALYI